MGCGRCPSSLNQQQMLIELLTKAAGTTTEVRTAKMKARGESKRCVEAEQTICPGK